MDTIIASIIVAFITGGLSLVGVIFTSQANNNKIEQQIMQSQAVTDVKIENLTSEVKKFGTYAERMTKLETKVEILMNKSDVSHET